MRIYLICKRYYTNKDLIKERFGRLYHLPRQWVVNGADVWVEAIDYRSKDCNELTMDGVRFRTTPGSLARSLTLPYSLYQNCLAVKPDIVFGSGDSHIGFMALLIAKKLRIPFVFDVYDYYPVFKGNIIPGMKTMFRYAVQEADLVLCASEPLLNKLACLNENRVLVENGVDTSLFSPMEMSQARKALGLQQDALFVGYFGSINSARGPLLIEACRIVRETFPSLQLLLAGKIVGINLGESWIIYLGELPQNTIPTLINACNVVTIPYTDTPFNRMCGACKIAEYLACGIPVVATNLSVHLPVFSSAPSSICDPTPESMAEAIRQQLTIGRCPEFPQHLSWNAIGDNLYNTLRSLRSF